MTNLKLMLLMFYHLDMNIEVKDDILEAVNVLTIAHELEAFADGAEITAFLKLMLYPDGLPTHEDEVAAKLWQDRIIKAGAKWYWWVIEGRVEDEPTNGPDPRIT